MGALGRLVGRGAVQGETQTFVLVLVVIPEICSSTLSLIGPSSSHKKGRWWV